MKRFKTTTESKTDNHQATTRPSEVDFHVIKVIQSSHKNYYMCRKFDGSILLAHPFLGDGGQINIENLVFPSILNITKFHCSNCKLLSRNGNLQTDFVFLSDYMPNGNLQTFFQKSKKSALTPTIKSKIAYGIAQAMYFLKLKSKQHKDILTLNSVFLDYKFEPRVSVLELLPNRNNSYPFGLKSMLQNDPSLIKYISPDYFSSWSSPIYFSVYSFAVILLSLAIEGEPEFDSPVTTFADAKEHIINSKTKFKIPNDKTPKELLNLIKDCLNCKEKEYEDIIKFLEQPNHLFKGTNMDEFTEYTKRFLDK